MRKGKRYAIQTYMTIIIVAVMLFIAVPVFAYLYRAPVAITENTSTSYDMLAVLWDQNNEWLADNGFMNSSANDTRVQTLAGLNKPWMVADNKTLTAIPVPADSQTNLYFSTGESEATDMDIITGYGGYVTTADAAPIELGDNWTVEQSVYLDTTQVGDNVTSKGEAFAISYPVAEEVEAAVGESGNTTYASPIADDTTAFTPSAGADNWAMVDDPPGSPDDIGTYVWYQNATYDYDLYDLYDYHFFSISTVNVTFRFRQDAADGAKGAFVKPSLWLNGASVNGTQVVEQGATWTTVSETISRPGGGDWQGSDFEDLQVGLWSFTTTATHKCQITQVYVTVIGARKAAVVSDDSVSSEEYIVKVEANGTFFGMDFDQTNSDCWPISDNLVFNAPLYFEELDGRPFLSVDSTVFTCNTTTAVWSNEGRIFDGVDDSIATNDSGAMNFSTEDFSIEVWLKASDITTHKAFVVRGTRDASGWWIGAPNNERLWFETCDAPASRESSYTATDVLLLDTWQHIVVTRSGANALFYVDGVSEALVSAGDHTTIVSSTNNLIIGDEASIGYDMAGTIGEVRVYNKLLSPAEVLANYNATKWKYDGLGNSYVEYAAIGAGVPDTSDDYILMAGDSVPYMEYLTMDIDGTEVLWYEPETMILATALPDRADGDGAQDGVITWGANPAGVGATLGGMSSSGQPDIGIGVDTSTADLLPEVGGTDWSTEPATGGALATNPLRPIVVAVSDNTTLSERQVWVWFGLILVVFVTAITAANVRGHHLITGIAASITIIALVVWTVFPPWSLVAIVLAVWGGLISERSPTV